MEPNLRVAFVCPRMTNDFSGIIWYSLQAAAQALGVRLTAVLGGPIDHPLLPLSARRVYDLLDPANFDGVLLHSSALTYDSKNEAIARFLSAHTPLPTVSLGLVLEGVSSVTMDQAAGVKQMVRHLHDQHGYRRFAFVCGPEEHIEAQIRKVAFLEELSVLGIGPDRYQLFPGNFNRSPGAAAVRGLLARSGPTALVCANDEEAIGALLECKARGIQVPGQIAVVGFDDIISAPMQEPSLTTVAQPLIRQAALALGMLVDQIRGDPSVRHIVEPPALLFRESCGCGPPPLLPVDDKSELLKTLLSTQTNSTENQRLFLRSWISDYLTAFEYLLETGNSSVLRSQWAKYYARLNDQERGISFRRLFAGLEPLYGGHASYQKSLKENIFLAGAAESRKGSQDDQRTRNYFFLLHNLEVLISHINDRASLAALPLSDLKALGVSGLAIVRFGAPPAMVYFRTPWTDDAAPESWGDIDYPALLPAAFEAVDPPAHRVVVSLTAEQAYLGYAVFWIESHESFVCDFLANQFAGALHRLELMERIREQSQSLEASLEESKRMQKQLVETEKVASLGRLVAGVAHEINTPLGTGITGTSFLLERLGEVRSQFDAGQLAKSGLAQFFAQGQEALDGVLRNLVKAAELVQAFKGLGPDHGRGEWKPLQLKTVFNDLRSVYEVEMSKRGIVLRCEFPVEDSLIYIQPSALVQVTGELLENAMDHAFPQGFAGRPQVLLQLELGDGLLRLAVTDNGRGLDEEEKRHLFDPLYTTQRPEGHAGLGLHLAFQLVTRTLGGQMTVASERESGSCFLCLIPLDRPKN